MNHIALVYDQQAYNQVFRLLVNEEIEKLQKEVAKKLGYKLVDHRLELYGSKIKK